jgi:hypothetical protein
MPPLTHTTASQSQETCYAKLYSIVMNVLAKYAEMPKEHRCGIMAHWLPAWDNESSADCARVAMAREAGRETDLHRAARLSNVPGGRATSKRLPISGVTPSNRKAMMLPYHARGCVFAPKW